MNATRKMLKPVCTFLAVLLLLITPTYQYASAAMIGTENILASDGHLETCGDRHHLNSRERIQKALVAGGVPPDEARTRIQYLTDSEIELIAAKIDQIPSGGNATGIIVISLAAILIIFLFVEFIISDVKMFPNLY